MEPLALSNRTQLAARCCAFSQRSKAKFLKFPSDFAFDDGSGLLLLLLGEVVFPHLGNLVKYTKIKIPFDGTLHIRIVPSNLLGWGVRYYYHGHSNLSLRLATSRRISRPLLRTIFLLADRPLPYEPSPNSRGGPAKSQIGHVPVRTSPRVTWE